MRWRRSLRKGWTESEIQRQAGRPHRAFERRLEAPEQPLIFVIVAAEIEKRVSIVDVHACTAPEPQLAADAPMIAKPARRFRCGDVAIRQLFDSPAVPADTAE